MFPTRARMLRAILLVAAVVVFVAGPARAATFLVSTTTDAADAAPGDGSCASGAGGCTLRAAIQEANALAGADAITLGAATYSLTIPGALEGAAVTGDLDIIQGLTITGAGARLTAIDGGDLDRVLDVDGGVTEVSVTGLTVRNGTETTGGGIRNNGVLTLDHAAVSGNAARAGGGIYNQAGQSLTVASSAVTGNQATFSDGGGIQNHGSLNLSNSTLSGNAAAPGGNGGALSDTGTGTATITNATIAGNSADPGRGPAISAAFGSTTTVTNSIIANGLGADNCLVAGGATFTSGGNNLIDGTCGAFGAATGDTINTNPQIGPLADNGGDTDTHALQATSPAIDAANAAFCPATDQRGGARPFPPGGGCDIGAFEAGALADVAIAKSASPSTLEASTTLTYTVTVTNDGPDEATGVQVEDALPAGPALGAVTTSQGSCTGQATLSCGIGTLAKGASAQVAISVVPSSAATLTNSASASALATDPDPENNSASATATVTAAATQQLALDSLAIKPAAFRPYRKKGASIAAKRGAKVSYKLSEDATVSFRVERLAKGRRVKGRCVGDSLKRRKRKRCTRVVKLKGTFTHAGKAGENSFTFTGRLRRKPLRKSRYRLVGTASAASGTSAEARTSFRIKR